MTYDESCEMDSYHGKCDEDNVCQRCGRLLETVYEQYEYCGQVGYQEVLQCPVCG